MACTHHASHLLATLHQIRLCGERGCLHCLNVTIKLAPPPKASTHEFVA